MWPLVHLTAVILLAAHAAAKDLSMLYEQSTLQYWQGRYSENIQWNFDNVVLKALRPSERRILASVKLEFPLRGGITGDPLEFYSYPRSDPPVVVMPVLSIKFFDDLAVAYSWLECNGYALDTVVDYAGMLKYVEPVSFPGGAYSAPLTALQIPADALDDTKVDALSQKVLKSALIWVLAHELGHIRFRHAGGISSAEAQSNEVEADRFATEIMRRIGVAPLGMACFFTVASHWWPNRSDFASEPAWQYYLQNTSHPLTATRLRTLADDLRRDPGYFVRTEPHYEKALAALQQATGDIGRLAEFLADEELQKASRTKVLLLTRVRDPLKPRRPGDSVVERLEGRTDARESDPRVRSCRMNSRVGSAEHLVRIPYTNSGV